MPEKIKRKRGGQIGNQNARKHGFYSVHPSPQEICEFWNAVNLGGTAPELVILRLKLGSVLSRDPGNRRVIREAFRLLAKWCQEKYRLNDKDNIIFKKFLRDSLEAAASSAGTNHSRTPEKGAVNDKTN